EITRLQGRRTLVEAQKLAALAAPAVALPAVIRARDHFLARLADQPGEAFTRLANIGRMLEHLRAWDAAADLHRTIARRHPESPAGRDALMRCARLEAGPLDMPMAALDTYAEYAARYPAELPYRQQPIGDRLRRLGYASVVEFQKRNRLTPDGRFGPISRQRLEELEDGFDAISVRDDAGSGIVRGEFVHPAMFAIAKRLDQAGRQRDAIAGYRVFLACFPAKKDADEALLAIARIFRDALLHEEALAAYGQLIEDYPKGDQTSGAYIESARCLENLGRWQEARERYELYAKKFPKYEFADQCRERVAALGEVLQYLDFIATNPDSPKLAEARYQIATILFKRFANWTRAAEEFAVVAERYPKHVRAPDALYTAGTALLNAEDFPAARALFLRLAKEHPESRLADDGQFWVGHSWEYGARALGKLDRARIVLKRRNLRSREALRADLVVRRIFFPGAQPVVEGAVPADSLRVLLDGSVRDRVNAELGEAIAAYRAVVDRFKTGDMAGPALLRIGEIYSGYLNDPEKGILAYQELLDHYPGSKQAVDALFQVGTHHLERKRYAEAVKAYQQFTYNYPQEAKVEDAMAAIARCHAESKAWDKALDAYQSYLAKFPAGKAAATARAQVEWIRMYHF
nr:tetratricopeptide repeat protein [Planctomycetota bacterium]